MPKIEEGKDHQTSVYSKDYSQLKGDDCSRNSLPQERVCQVVIPYKTVSPKTYIQVTANKIQSEQFVFRNQYVN